MCSCKSSYFHHFFFQMGLTLKPSLTVLWGHACGVTHRYTGPGAGPESLDIGHALCGSCGHFRGDNAAPGAAEVQGGATGTGLDMLTPSGVPSAIT